MKNRILFTFIVFLAVANVLTWSLLGVQAAYAERVYPGILVEAQPLNGLTKDQVIDKLEPIKQALLRQQVTLHLANKTFQPTLKELGYTVDTATMADAALKLGRGKNLKDILQQVVDYQRNKTIPIAYSVDQGVFDNYLNDISKGIVKEPKNISLDYQDGNLLVHPAETGIALNKEELRQAIQKEIKPKQVADITLSYNESAPALIDEAQIADAKATLTKLLAQPLQLQAEDQSVSLTPAVIYSFVYYEVKDNKLTINFNEDKIREEVAKFAKKVDVTPVVQQISAVNNAVLQEGRDGRQLNVPDAMQRIKQRLISADFSAPITLAVTKTDRKVTTISPEYQLGRYEGRYIEVDLSAQRMHLIEGQNYHKTMIISTGSWSHPTPIGTFQILNHISVAWSNRYKLYMPHWMALQQDSGSYDGYGIHGLPYWPNGAKEGVNHLGTPVSHGCIRIGPADEEYVYNWAVNGTPVVIHQ